MRRAKWKEFFMKIALTALASTLLIAGSAFAQEAEQTAPAPSSEQTAPAQPAEESATPVEQPASPETAQPADQDGQTDETPAEQPAEEPATPPAG